MKCGFLGLMVMCWVGLQSYAQGPGFWRNRSRSADFGQARSALAYSRFSQFEGLDTLYRKVKGFGVGLPQEKAYLHLDNTCYFLGDTIWYKGKCHGSPLQQQQADGCQCRGCGRYGQRAVYAI